MTIRAIIWDMGGVLVRTEDYGPRDGLAARLGLTRYELEGRVFGGRSGDGGQRGEISAEQHWENVRTAFGLDAAGGIAFEQAFFGGDRLDESLVNYIRSLRGQYRTALLSNAFNDLRRRLHEQWPIADAFDEIVISAEVGAAKPDPAIYRAALDRLGLEPGETVFIDDFPVNIDGARAVGMHAIRFVDPAQMRADLEALLARVGGADER